MLSFVVQAEATMAAGILALQGRVLRASTSIETPLLSAVRRPSSAILFGLSCSSCNWQTRTALPDDSILGLVCGGVWGNFESV
jgi:hypothetical protein